MGAVTFEAEQLSTLDSRELMRREREIAERYMGRFPWLVVIWALANLACWLSLWPLTLLGVISPWVALPIATLNASICYLPSHEAQHDIIARPGQPLRWLNELIGHLSTIPLAAPYKALRLTHLEHHKHTNHPELDPDSVWKASSGWAFLGKAIVGLQPGSEAAGAYGRCLERMGGQEAKAAGQMAIVYEIAFIAILSAMAWTGHAIVAACVWWAPRLIGNAYTTFFLSWAPHNPGLEVGRYRDTRGFKSRVGALLSSGMQHHIVHHLHPRIPLLQNAAAFRALRPILVARGCRLDGI